MTDEMLFKQMSLVRSRTLKFMESITEQTADMKPEGFNNTIRWNLGHIFTVQEILALQYSGKSIVLTDEMKKMFGNGSKPDDWTTAPPTLQILIEMLKEQTDRIKLELSGQLGEQITRPFQGMDTIGELLNYSTYHEGIHQGYIMALKRLVNPQ